MMKMTKNSVFFTVLIILLLGFSCKSSNDDQSVVGLKVELVSSTPINWVGHWKNEGDRGKLVKEVANEFEFTHQQYSVNLKFPEDLYNAEDSKEIQFIIKQITNPTPEWDIIRIKEHYMPIATILNDPYWGEKYLVDFSEVKGFFDSQLSFVNAPIMKQRTGNIFTGPFNEGFYWALFVNTEVAKKIGIEVKQYGMTIEDLKGYLKALFEYNKTNKTHISGIFEDAGWISTETMFKQLCYSLFDNFSEVIDSKLTQRKLDAIEKTYKAFEELSKYQPIIKNRRNINWGRDNDYPLKDSCLFIVNGSWMYNIWKMKNNMALHKMVPCELPSFAENKIYVGGYTSNWAIPKNAPHKAAAIELMMYWSQPEIAEKWARYTKCPTGIKGNLTTSTFGFDPYESFVYTIDKKFEGKKIHPVENRYLFGEKNFRLPLRVIEVLEGTITANQAITEFKKKAQF